MIRIGLLDTGVDTCHPDLVGKVSANYEIVRDEVVKIGLGSDPGNHGTACADILSRHASHAEIHSVQVIGNGSSDSLHKLITGLRFAIDQGWEVININAGAGRPHRLLERCVNHAIKNGRIIVAAKSNHPDEIGYPAAYPGVIAVDMNHFDDPFDWRFFSDAPVEVEAHGIYVEAASARGGREKFTGASFAAPHVAALAACFKERNTQGDAADFRRMLATRSQSPCLRSS